MLSRDRRRQHLRPGRVSVVVAVGSQERTYDMGEVGIEPGGRRKLAASSAMDSACGRTPKGHGGAHLESVLST
jgi:hypothetical protein